MKIVLVEDEAAARNGIGNMLRQHTQHELCAVAANGEQGFAYIQEMQPELVITDIRMPKMSGLQMMHSLKVAGCKAEFIILSGYSDFQYAQEALQLGACDYILKPVTPEALRTSIARVEEKHYSEVRFTPTAEYMLNQLVEGMGDTDDILQQLAWMLRIPPERPCAMLLLHLNNCRSKDAFYTGFVDAIHNEVEELCLEALRIIPLAPREGVFCIVGDCDKMPRLENMLAKYLVPDIRSSFDCTAAYLQIENFHAVVDGIGRLKELLLKTSQENEEFFCESAAAKSPATGEYPTALENDIKKHIFQHDSAAFLEQAKKLVREVWQKDGSSIERKDELIRFFSVVGMQMQEFYGNRTRNVFKNLNLHRILDAVTGKELLDASFAIIEEVALFLRAHETQQNLGKLVGETVRYIETHYQETLDQKEIAARMGVTPEYLSTQFTKETGTSFSAYIRQYRIRQAKFILVNTDRKMQEVGVNVGYADPAYFNRIFRGECGMTPTEYRKNFKAGSL